MVDIVVNLEAKIIYIYRLLIIGGQWVLMMDNLLVVIVVDIAVNDGE